MPAANVGVGWLGAEVVASSIAVNGVHTGALADGAVTSAKINDLAATKITAGTLGSDVVASSVPAANVGVGWLGAEVVASSIAVNGVHTGALADGAVTDAKIGGMAASKLTGSLPEALRVFSDANCDSLTPANKGQFCYDTTLNMLSISTSTEVGGYAGIAMDVLTTW